MKLGISPIKLAGCFGLDAVHDPCLAGFTGDTGFRRVSKSRHAQ